MDDGSDGPCRPLLCSGPRGGLFRAHGRGLAVDHPSQPNQGGGQEDPGQPGAELRRGFIR